MDINVVAEVIAIRERVARIETILEQIRQTLDATKRSVERPVPAGSVVVPVAVITSIIQGGIAVFQHLI